MLLTTDELVAMADQLQALEDAFHLEKLDIFAEIDRRRAYEEDGARSMVDWLTYRYDMRPETARDEVRVAHAMQELPKVREAVSEGRICWDKLREIAKVATADDDAEWAKEAERSSFAQVRDSATRRRGMQRAKLEHEQQARYLKLGWHNDSGFLRFSGRLPGADGAAVKAAFDRMTQQLGPDEHGTWKPLDQRRADALVELARVKIAEDSDVDRALVTVTVSARDLNHFNGVAEIELGPLVPSEVARKLSCDGTVQVVTVDDEGSPIGIGRRSRVVPPWLFRLVKQRDKGCVSCGNTHGVQAHHKVHWAHGGATDLGNLVLMCWKCHDLLHNLNFQLRRNEDSRYELVRPDGRLVRRGPEPLRPDIRQRMLGPPALVG
jgi:hypothetical protein